MSSISIIGAGSWGSALALTLGHAGKKVTLWGHNPQHMQEIMDHRINSRYLPGIPFPESIHLTTSLAEAAKSEVIFFVVPSKFLRNVAQALQEVLPLGHTPIVVSCTKGIEHATGNLMSTILSTLIPTASVAVLSGPNLAGDIARGLPTAGVLGCEQQKDLACLQKVFHQTTYRAYTSNDVAGIQLGGALKNIFAIATGVCDGLGMGENARASLITRALAEMTRLGIAMGGRRETFSGLSGIGDLMATCTSTQSRTYQVGVQLCQGKSVEEIQSSMEMVAEGLFTARSAQACAQKKGVDIPIIDEVVAVLDHGKTAQEAMRELFSRRLRAEEEA